MKTQIGMLVSAFVILTACSKSIEEPAARKTITGQSSSSGLGYFIIDNQIPMEESKGNQITGQNQSGGLGQLVPNNSDNNSSLDQTGKRNVTGQNQTQGLGYLVSNGNNIDQIGKKAVNATSGSASQQSVERVNNSGGGVKQQTVEP